MRPGNLLIAVEFGALIAGGALGANWPATPSQDKPTITVYKSPT